MKRVALAMMLAAMAGPASAEELPPEAKQAVIDSIKDRLFDGESARWRWPEKVEGASVYCGFLSSKNRFGAYTGFKPFAVMLAQGTKGWASAPLIVGDTDDAETVAREMCAERGYALAMIPPE